MIDKLTLKGFLAFILIAVSASMVFFWMGGVFIFKSTIDAGMAALLASFVTMFIKMAADASGYQYTSSAGSEKKDDRSANVLEKLTSSTPPATGPVAPVVAVAPVAWWNKLNDAERAAIASASSADKQVQAFVTAANAGNASLSDIAYLVSKGLITAERATAIQAT